MKYIESLSNHMNTFWVAGFFLFCVD